MYSFDDWVVTSRCTTTATWTLTFPRAAKMRMFIYYLYTVLFSRKILFVQTRTIKCFETSVPDLCPI